jgi:hypothetical protein
LTVTVALVVKVLPVPVTVTVKVPGDEELQDRVEAPEGDPLLSVTLFGDRVQARPADGEIAAVRLTAPANPFRLVTVTAEFPFPPEGKFIVAGLAATVKSCIV